MGSPSKGVHILMVPSRGIGRSLWGREEESVVHVVAYSLRGVPVPTRRLSWTGCGRSGGKGSLASLEM